MAIVKNKDLIEDCMKHNLKQFQKIKEKEIYDVDPKIIKKKESNSKTIYCYRKKYIMFVFKNMEKPSLMMGIISNI